MIPDPGKFSCPKCGCNRFTLIKKTFTDVDFNQEGAIEGHPFLSNVGEKFDCILCYECGEDVPEEQAQKMLKEII